MLEPVPWAINGATSTADIAREIANAATFDGNGIRFPTDLKVQALETPGPFVRVAPGTGILRNIYSGGEGESYGVNNRTETQVPVPATDSSGGAIRYLILRTTDPQFRGSHPVDGIYNTFEWVSTLAGIDYPHIPLCRLNQPLNTATITSGMIDQDLRQMAVPLIYGRKILIYPSQNHIMPTSVYSSWPILSDQRPTLQVPKWATKLDVVGHFSGIEFRGTSRTVAGIRSGFGAEGAENGIMIEDRATRGHYTVAGTHTVLDTQRGTSQLLNLQGVRSAGTGEWEADYQSAIVIDYQFTGEPV